MTSTYSEFIQAKRRRFKGDAIAFESLSDQLYPFQRDLAERALEAGRYAIFADCGLGKTLMELEWASHVPGRVLLLAPIAVSYQIEREAVRFGYDAKVSAGEHPGTKITLSNYEKLHRFDPAAFDAVVLDESSILKSVDGKTRAAILDRFRDHKYKLAATATPSPNDFMELGNHAEFLGAMTRAEMLAMFFVHDGGSTQDWRLKGHAVLDFWQWVGSWAAMIRSPADMGYDAGAFKLPSLSTHHHVVDADFDHHALIPGATTLSLHERRAARRSSIEERTDHARSLSDGDPDSWLFWCDLNDESEQITKKVADAVEVRGPDTEEHKRDSFTGFADGTIRRLVTKPRIGGWGMNWQQCHKMAFVGLSDSYEAFYQCTRRCWRFGQEYPVEVHLIYSDHERAVVENVLSKERKHEEMQDALVQEVMR